MSINIMSASEAQIVAESANARTEQLFASLFEEIRSAAHRGEFSVICPLGSLLNVRQIEETLESLGYNVDYDWQQDRMEVNWEPRADAVDADYEQA